MLSGVKMCEASGPGWECDRSARTGSAIDCDMHKQQRIRGRVYTKPGKPRRRGKVDDEGLVWCKECQTFSDRSNFNLRADTGGPATYCKRHERDVYLRHQYNVTIEQYESLLAKQDGVCRITGCAVSEGLHVDHAHSCCPGTRSCGNCIRGLLCQRHNMAIGLFGDDVDALRSAAEYLEHHR